LGDRKLPFEDDVVVNVNFDPFSIPGIELPELHLQSDGIMLRQLLEYCGGRRFGSEDAETTKDIRSCASCHCFCHIKTINSPIAKVQLGWGCFSQRAAS
jgi:hypothetical protein